MERADTTEPAAQAKEAADGERPGRPPAALAGGAVGAAVVLVVAAWLVDGQVHSGQVQRNVTLSGRPVGGLDRVALSERVAQLAREYADSEVRIRVASDEVTARAPELGLGLRQDRTVDAAMSVGRRGFVAGRFLSWLGGLFRPRVARAAVRVDQRSVARVLERDPGRTAPVEPSIAVEGDRVVPVEGKPGRGVEAATVVDALSEAAPKGLPLRVSVERTELAPRFGIEQAREVAAKAQEVSQSGLRVAAGAVTATVPPETIRKLLVARPTEDGLRLAVDAEAIPDALSALLPSVGRPARDAGFTISGGQVQITPSRTGQRCCAPQAAALLEAALLAPPADRRPVLLPVETVLPRRNEEAAARLGVVEPVGSFTTGHPGGQPRVRNIHLIADKVRGAVIEPGRTFSVNDYVGPRTPDRGYVDAPVIGENQTFSTSPGGGVSQFATTLFNAAFFAGLDIPAYGMHGLYINRYPYGREATLSYGSIDLRIRNNTPHGVLIWTSYSDTSITVTLYSTKTVQGEQTGQTTATTGPECTLVTTERTRRYVDGRPPTVDTFRALYAPKEGVKCR